MAKLHPAHRYTYMYMYLALLSCNSMRAMYSFLSPVLVCNSIYTCTCIMYCTEIREGPSQDIHVQYIYIYVAHAQ